MIGIIGNNIGSYSIIEKVKNKYKNIDIYLVDSISNKNIDRLLNKGCKIIISIDKIDDNLINNYSDIKFLYLDNIIINNMHVIDNKDLIDAVCKGDIFKVREMLEKEDIKNDEIIVLNNPILLFIKSLIKEIYSNEIVDNIDNMLVKLEEYFNDNNINTDNDGLLELLVE